ncbi:hypothetical protein UFOVP275_46 [uncultured Caudovirales phage]|uniref:Terminase small subunit n=1 Tax=uncultured Caudovirales phage TaxID=2100421 RepID=A0A6J5LN32_9CAUD|nr:hypothetical protein UFOVP275_46 [uncultured Caudovirales phage]
MATKPKPLQKKKTAKAPPKPAKRSRGRPTTVDFDLCSKIFDRMTVDGESLRAICRDDDFPAIGTFLRWVSAHSHLREQYDMAMQLRAEKHVEEIIEIADDAVNDWMEINGKDDVGYKVNGEHVQRSRLRIDARKWAASKLLPRYADKVDLNHGGQTENPLSVLFSQISGTPLRPEK